MKEHLKRRKQMIEMLSKRGYERLPYSGELLRRGVGESPVYILLHRYGQGIYRDEDEWEIKAYLPSNKDKRDPLARYARMLHLHTFTNDSLTEQIEQIEKDAISFCKLCILWDEEVEE